MKKYNITELEEKLKRCGDIPIKEVDPNDVDNLDDIKIDRRKNPNERILDFISKTKNPYIFKINGRLVKIEFSDNEKSAEECITKVIKSLYK